MPKKSTNKQSQTALLVAILFVFGTVALYAASSDNGSLFQGALRYTTDSANTGVSRTVTVEEESRSIEKSDSSDNPITAGSSSGASTNIDAGGSETELEMTASAEDDVRVEDSRSSDSPITADRLDNTSANLDAVREEEIELNLTLSASAEEEDLREAADSGITIGSSSTPSSNIDASPNGTISPSAVQIPNPQCPSVSYMMYLPGGSASDSFEDVLSEIAANPAGCSYQFVLTSGEQKDIVTCSANELSVFNGQIKCNKILSQGSLHVIVTVDENEARYSHRFDLGQTYRTFTTPDVTIWKLDNNS